MKAISRLVFAALTALTAWTATAANLPVSSYTVSPAPGFADSGGELTDGALGDPTTFGDLPWVAWQNTTPVLTFDLGSAQTVSGMTIHYMDNTGTAGSTIHAPSAATVTYSTDGTTYSTAGTFSGTTIFPRPGGNNAGSQAYGVMTFANVTARYVRVSVTRSTQWLFFDEVTIQGQSTVPDIAVAQTSTLTDGTSTVDFGTTAGGVVKTFTITNPGVDPLTSLSVSKDGANSSEFVVSALSQTTVNSTGGDSATFTVTFNPAEAGTRSAAIHIASNVSGSKNPFDINLTGAGNSTLPGVAIASFTGGSSFGFNNERFTVGWEFTTTSPISVSSLGFYDVGNDGLLTTHPVGLWNASGTLLASGTVPAGTAATSVGGFRYVNITPVVLPPGTYRIGGLIYNGGGNDLFLYAASTINTNAGVAFGSGYLVQSNDNVLHFPTLSSAAGGLPEKGLLGPNFKFAVVPNVAPVFDPGANVTLDPGLTAFSRTVSFTDSDANTWSGTVDYGDGGAASALSVDQGAKTFALNHSYATTGAHTVSVTLTDGLASVTHSLTVTTQPYDFGITITAGVLALTPSQANGVTIHLDEAGPGELVITGAGLSFLYGTSSGAGSSSAIPLASVTSIVINGTPGDDIIVVGDFPQNVLPSLTINGGTGNDEVRLEGSLVFADGANLNVDLQDDSATPGIDRIVLDTHTRLELTTGNVILRASRDIDLTQESSITVGSGSITLEANQQAVATSGDFAGITVRGSTLSTTGSGAITLRGRGGNAAFAASGGGGGGNLLAAKARKAFVANLGGTASAPNCGVHLSGAQLTQSGPGGLVLQGTSVADGDNASGISMENASASTQGGDVQMTGEATGTGTGNNRPGIDLGGSNGSRIVVGNDGDLTLLATGAPGNGDGNAGLVLGGNASLQVEDGALMLDGTGGQGGAGATGVDRPGLILQGQIAAFGNGDVLIEGTAGTSSTAQNGVDIDAGAQGGLPVIATDSGDVSLSGTASGGGHGLDLDAQGGALVHTDGGGAVNLNADQIALTDSVGGSTSAITSSGDLAIAPVTPGAPAPITLNAQTLGLLTTNSTLLVNNIITNRAPTALDLSNTTLDENNATGFTIGALTFTDLDTPAQSPVFTLATGLGDDDNDLFTIVGNTLAAAVALDADARADYSVRLKVSDGFGGSFQRIVTIHVNDLADTPIQLWKQLHFGSFANTGDTADGGDFNHNGVLNLLEFAFGTDPAGSAALHALQHTGNVITPGSITSEPDNSGALLATWIRRKDHATAGIIYTVQFSADLTTWETDATPPAVLADDGTNQVVALSYPLLSSGAQATFFKVTVSTP